MYSTAPVDWALTDDTKKEDISHDFKTNVNELNEKKGFTLKKKKARSRWYPGETNIDTDYADDLALLKNTLTQAEFLLHSL